MFCDISFFIMIILFMFLTLILWIISPVGILFFLASKALFSKESSALKRKIAWTVQGIAFLTWTSLMTIMLIIYLDALSYNILNFRSAILDFAITSGFAFLFIMLAVCVIEKRVIVNNKEEKASAEKKNFRKNKKTDQSVKIASVKTGGSIKTKIRRKIKKDLKEIVNDEIDKRL
ncbi:MAG: hypothetical protein U9N04_04220 [Patescibacteria group bacterium]|nr:hypothetical protein [Patescibacteria group bacterium]